jgi:protein TonB
MKKILNNDPMFMMYAIKSYFSAPNRGLVRKTAAAVSLFHAGALLLVAFWAVLFATHPEPLVMMAEIVDRESSAMVQTIKKQAVKDQRQEKKDKVATRETAVAQEQASSKTVAGDPAAAPVHMPDASASDLHNPKPPYPPVSRSKGEQGTVLLKVCVAATGEVDSVDVAKSSGYVRLDRAANDTVNRWRFHPARKGGQAVPMCYQLPIRFSLDQAVPATTAAPAQ